MISSIQRIKRFPFCSLRRSVSNRLVGDGSFLANKEAYKVTVIGGGNAAHILIGYIGSMPNVEVKMLNSLKHEREAFRSNLNKCIKIKHRNGQNDITGHVKDICEHPEECIPASDLVLLAVPGHIHEHYLKMIAPFIHSNQNVGVMTAQGCLDLVARDLFHNIFDFINFFSFETLPWACRTTKQGFEAEVLGTKECVDVACHPSDFTLSSCHILSQLLSRGVTNPKSTQPEQPINRPHFIAAPNQLCLTLMNINSIWHPCITYGRFRQWDGKKKFPTIPLFYEGVDDFTANLLSKVSDEVLAVKTQLLSQYPHLDLGAVRHVREWILTAYGDQIIDKTSLRSCIATNKAYEGLLHPMTSSSTTEFLPDTTHRFWVEDLTCGMIATRGIAELVGVETPQMDKVIQWMQQMKQKEYLVQGSGGKLVLSGRDLKETRAPQRFGIKCVAEIIHEYEHYN